MILQDSRFDRNLVGFGPYIGNVIIPIDEYVSNFSEGVKPPTRDWPGRGELKDVEVFQQANVSQLGRV